MASLAQLYGPTQILIHGKRINVTFYPEKIRHTVAVKAAWSFEGDNHVRALANEEYGHGAKDRLLHQIEAAARHFLLEAHPHCPPVLVGLVGIDGGHAHALQEHLLAEAEALFTPLKYHTTLAETDINPATTRHLGLDEFELSRRANQLLAVHDAQHFSWAINNADILALKDDFRAGLIAARPADWQAVRAFADAHGIHTRCFRIDQTADGVVAGLLRKYHDDSTKMTGAYAARIARVLDQVHGLQAFTAFDFVLDLEHEIDMAQAGRQIIRDIKVLTTRAVLNIDHSEPAQKNV